jgi:hypothetical protein
LPKKSSGAFNRVRCFRFVWKARYVTHEQCDAHQNFLHGNTIVAFNNLEKIVIVFDFDHDAVKRHNYPRLFITVFQWLTAGSKNSKGKGVQCLELGIQGVDSKLEHLRFKELRERISMIDYITSGNGMADSRQFGSPTVEDNVRVGDSTGAVWTWNLRTEIGGRLQGKDI